MGSAFLFKQLNERFIAGGFKEKDEATVKRKVGPLAVTSKSADSA